MSELPPIRRARGYHLYDVRGRRYLDLHLSGGRALLGHRPERSLLELKNLLARGLAGELPSVFEHRLSRALSGLLPDHPTIRVFSNEERLLEMLSPLVAGPAEIEDPVLDDQRPAPPGSSSEGAKAAGHPRAGVSGSPPAERGAVRVLRWRPFLPSTAADAGPSIAVPVLPFPGAFAPAVACIRGIPEERLPPSDVVSPALLGALVRSAYDLAAFTGYDERVWARFDAPWWERKGPYFVARCENSEYSLLFRRLLEKGILVSPHYPGPSMAPAEFTPGELDPLRRLAQEWVGP